MCLIIVSVPPEGAIIGAVLAAITVCVAISAIVFIIVMVIVSKRGMQPIVLLYGVCVCVCK